MRVGRDRDATARMRCHAVYTEVVHRLGDSLYLLVLQCQEIGAKVRTTVTNVQLFTKRGTQTYEFTGSDRDTTARVRLLWVFTEFVDVWECGICGIV